MTDLDKLIATYTVIAARDDIGPEWRVCARMPNGELRPVGTRESARAAILEAASLTPDPPACDPGSLSERLKAAVSRILGDALDGSEPRYRYEPDEKHHRGYVRWGLVEREIHGAIADAVAVHEAIEQLVAEGGLG